LFSSTAGSRPAYTASLSADRVPAG